jgi:C4-dicarboxylate-specific signal transduction histidine kinase
LGIHGSSGRPEGNPAQWYGVMINIDERRRIEEALKNTREQLSRAAQVATLGELSASIAHEVNQPLAAVVANGHACLRWLAAQPPNLVKAQEAAERVVRDGREAGEVVKRIRALFRRTEDQRVELDLNSVILEVVSLIRSETVPPTNFSRDRAARRPSCRSRGQSPISTTDSEHPD